MRISDWSSDVCSSDLLVPAKYGRIDFPAQGILCRRQCEHDIGEAYGPDDHQVDIAVGVQVALGHRSIDEGAIDPVGQRCEFVTQAIHDACGLSQDRKSVVTGQSV